MCCQACIGREGRARLARRQLTNWCIKRGQRVLGQVGHGLAGRDGDAVVHRQGVDAGDRHLGRQHRVEHGLARGGEPVGRDRQGQPDRQVVTGGLLGWPAPPRWPAPAGRSRRRPMRRRPRCRGRSSSTCTGRPPTCRPRSAGSRRCTRSPTRSCGRRRRRPRPARRADAAARSGGRGRAGGRRRERVGSHPNSAGTPPSVTRQRSRARHWSRPTRPGPRSRTGASR